MDHREKKKNSKGTSLVKAKRKTNAPHDHETTDTSITPLPHKVSKSTNKPLPLKIVRLVQASGEFVSEAVTCVLYELSLASTSNALELYLSLFEIVYSGTLNSPVFEPHLTGLGYTVMTTKINDKSSCIRYLKSKGWSLTDVLRWTKEQYPLKYEELWTGFFLYGLLIGKELTPLDYEHRVNARAIALYSHCYFRGNRDFCWSAENFLSQPVTRHLYHQLCAQPIRANVFRCLKGLENVAFISKFSTTVLTSLRFSNMSHINMIQLHLVKLQKLLSLPALQPHVSELEKALNFLESMPEEDRPFARLLRDHEDCRVLSTKNLMPFVIATQIVMEELGEKLKSCKGLETLPQQDYLRKYLEPHVKKAIASFKTGQARK